MMVATLMRTYGYPSCCVQYVIHIPDIGLFLLGFYGVGYDQVPRQIMNVFHALTIGAQRSWIELRRYDQLVVETARLEIYSGDADLVRLYAIPIIGSEGANRAS